jgi:hypothetical protein
MRYEYNRVAIDGDGIWTLLLLSLALSVRLERMCSVKIAYYPKDFLFIIKVRGRRDFFWVLVMFRYISPVNIVVG